MNYAISNYEYTVGQIAVSNCLQPFCSPWHTLKCLFQTHAPSPVLKSLDMVHQELKLSACHHVSSTPRN